MRFNLVNPNKLWTSMSGNGAVFMTFKEENHSEINSYRYFLIIFIYLYLYYAIHEQEFNFCLINFLFLCV